MAQPPRPAANGDNFVRHVVPDPKNVPDVMLLYGYLGASSEEADERLSLSADLSNYVEVPTASILHRAQSAAEKNSLGGVTLWVRKDAALKYKMAPAAEAAQQALAAYFTEAIQAGAGGAAAAPNSSDNSAAALPAADGCAADLSAADVGVHVPRANCRMHTWDRVSIGSSRHMLSRVQCDALSVSAAPGAGPTGRGRGSCQDNSTPAFLILELHALTDCTALQLAAQELVTSR